MGKIIKFLFLLIVLILIFNFTIACTAIAELSNAIKKSVTASQESADIEVIAHVSEDEITEEEPLSEEAYPEPVGYVNDFADIIEQEYEDKINTLAIDLEEKTTAEIVVVTIDSLEGKTIEEYAFGLFNFWGIGKKDINNGILFLVSLKELSFRIEVGLGLESVITNDIAKNILDEIVMPRFQEGEYGLGSYECAKEIADYIISDN